MVSDREADMITTLLYFDPSSCTYEPRYRCTPQMNPNHTSYLYLRLLPSYPRLAMWMCILTLEGLAMDDTIDGRAKESLTISVRAVEWSARG